MVTNNNINLSPSLIYQLSLHASVTAPSQYSSCNYHYNIADITLLPPPQSHNMIMITVLFLIYADKIVLIDNWKN